jgi:hypothetical protein
MTYPFKVRCDECALTLSFSSGNTSLAVDISPEQARRLAQDLIDKAQDCEDAQEHELEQMA